MLHSSIMWILDLQIAVGTIGIIKPISSYWLKRHCDALLQFPETDIKVDLFTTEVLVVNL